MNVRFLLLAPFFLGLSACVGGGETCTVNDVTYDFGETFDALDGCNQCLCGEGGAISCTLIGCVPVEPEVDAGVEPDVDAGILDAGTDAGIVDAGGVDAGADAGVVDAGIVDAGVVDAGVLDSGVLDSGVLDAGVLDSGVLDSGVLDSGVLDSGVLDAGVLDAGVLDAGPVVLEGCTQLTDQAAHCMCGTNNPNRVFTNFGDQECALVDAALCTDDCCGPNEMVDPNDYAECVPRGAPYVQNFGVFPPDDTYFFHGYVAGASTCTFTSQIAGEAEVVTIDTPGPGRSGDGVTTGAGVNIFRALSGDDFWKASSFAVECENEFGGVSASVDIPLPEERFSVTRNVDGTVDFCRNVNSNSIMFEDCTGFVGPSSSACLVGGCEYSFTTPFRDVDGCHQSAFTALDDGDTVGWVCRIDFRFGSQNQTIPQELTALFTYDDSTDSLVYIPN